VRDTLFLLSTTMPTDPDAISIMSLVYHSVFRMQCILKFNKSGYKHSCVPRDGEFLLAIVLLSFPESNHCRIVPNYELAPNLEHIEILRVVVRENTTEIVRGLIFILSVCWFY
jgi:hypothetical protein